MQLTFFRTLPWRLFGSRAFVSVRNIRLPEYVPILERSNSTPRLANTGHYAKVILVEGYRHWIAICPWPACRRDVQWFIQRWICFIQTLLSKFAVTQCPTILKLKCFWVCGSKLISTWNSSMQRGFDSISTNLWRLSEAANCSDVFRQSGAYAVWTRVLYKLISGVKSKLHYISMYIHIY